MPPRKNTPKKQAMPALEASPTSSNVLARNLFRDTVVKRPPRTLTALAALARDLTTLHAAALEGDCEAAINAATNLRGLERRIPDVKNAVSQLRIYASASRDAARKQDNREGDAENV